MPHVPPAEIERLKREIPVQRLAEARGIELHRHGKDLIGLCPFHEDHAPSLVITPEKNLWNCLGACQFGGTVIDWVMKTEHVSFRHAVEILKAGSVAGTVPLIASPKPATAPKLPPPIAFDAEDRDLMTQLVGYYHQTLKDSPEALSYLESRGVQHSEMIDHFKLGYANRTLGLRLPDKHRKTGVAIRERLARLGIMRDSGHEHFNGCITFPIFDNHHQVAGIYGRKAADVGRLRPGTAYHLYIPGPHKGVWNGSALSATSDVILCEAIIDALSFWCAGFRNVTASYGVNGFTPDHLAIFRQSGIKRVFIAYDRDDAGDRAAESLAPRLIAEGYEVFRILFPRGMDANEYALKVQPPAKSLEVLIRNAVWIGGASAIAKQAPTEGQASKGETMAAAASGPLPGHSHARAATPAPGPVPDQVSVPSAPPDRAECSARAQDLSLDADQRFAPIAHVTPGQEPVGPATAGSQVEVRKEEIIIVIGDRRYRIRGMSKNMSYEQMKVNLLISRGDAYFVDTLDLFVARNRAVFQKQASSEMCLNEDVIRSDLGKVLLKLEDIQDRQIKEALEPKEHAVELTDAERAEAMEFLKAPNLIERILSDFETCGIVGEETNKLTGYLAAVSRKLEKPLAIIIQSSSSAGKTSLMEAVLAFIPAEERVKYSAMTGQSLFYMGETNLKHKILAIVEEEGAERASYALKLLQSEGELTIASTGKDPQTGRQITHEYHVEGPVMIFVTTTSVDIDEELQNRCIVLTVNESREQTRAIHVLQREMETLEGLVSLRNRSLIYKKHANAQRLLEPLLVANPYARHLTFLDDTTRTRRDHVKYLTLIRTIALLHQHQRPRKTTTVRGVSQPFIEVTYEDIELANGLANEMLGRTLDELLPQTRRFLDLLFAMVRENCEKFGVDQADYRFQRREVCKYTGWSLTQARLHLARLVELEYVLVHRGFRGQCFVYELLYNDQGKDGKPFVLGLLEVSRLRERTGDYGAKVAGFSVGVAGQNAELAGPKRPQSAPETGGWWAPESQRTEATDADLREPVPQIVEKTHIEDPVTQESYRSEHHTAGATEKPTKAAKQKSFRGQRLCRDGRRGREFRRQRFRRDAQEGRLMPVSSVQSWDLNDPRGFPVLVEKYLEAIRVKNFSANTIDSRLRNLRFFFAWCEPRGLMQPQQITLPILEGYQRFLYHFRMKNQKPLGIRTQFMRLQSIRAFYRWLARGHYILSNPAADLELPKPAKKLPRNVLTLAEVEQVMNIPDVKSTLGLRDRAILETFYSTGMRRAELLGLHLYDMNPDQGIVCIRCGKGQKDRMVPIGDRALSWLRKYLDESRPSLVIEPDEGFVFLAFNGAPLAATSLSEIVRDIIKESGVAKRGSCHLFRHTMATHMLEGGADIRFIQQMLGHSQLTTTEIYTQVTIRKLREVFLATHPGAKLKHERSVPAEGDGEPSEPVNDSSRR